MKIGYVPYSEDLSQPADRRRFPFFAMRNQIDYEIANTNNLYDVVLLTAPSNLSKWLKYKKKNPGTKFIFEMVDGLIFPVNLFFTIFKGIGRYLMKREDSIYINYNKLLYKWITIADVVICSGIETKEILKSYNSNVFVSLDYMSHEVRIKKNNFSISGKMKLVWEGQPSVLSHFRAFREVLQKLSPFCELHVITDEKYPVAGGVFYRDTKEFLESLPIKTIFHKWEFGKNYEDLIQCDCGIIPIDKKNRFAWYKPSNKLISFWFAGIPAVVTNTPAYVGSMNGAGLSLYCRDADEWVEKITMIYEMDALQREALSRQADIYNNKENSPERLDLVWKSIFERITAMF